MDYKKQTNKHRTTRNPNYLLGNVLISMNYLNS